MNTAEKRLGKKGFPSVGRTVLKSKAAIIVNMMYIKEFVAFLNKKALLSALEAPA